MKVKRIVPLQGESTDHEREKPLRLALFPSKGYWSSDANFTAILQEFFLKYFLVEGFQIIPSSSFLLEIFCYEAV